MVMAAIYFCTMRRGPLRTFFLVAVGYILFVYGMTFAMSRYRLGTMLLLIIAAAAAVAAPRTISERLRSRRRLAATAVVLMLLFAAWALRIGDIWIY